MRKSKIQRYLRHGTLPQLRVFEAVARHGNFTRAAAELHLAQPTVSLQIKKLTEIVGLPLLEHVGKRVSPTVAGAALNAACEEIIGALVRFEDALANIRGLTSGSLKITAGTTEKYIVTRLVAAFVRRHPIIEVSVQVLQREALCARLMEAADDLYVLTQPPQSGSVVAEPILPNPFVVLARRDHPLARAQSVPFARFAQEPLIVREPGSRTHAVTMQMFAARGLKAKARMEFGSNEAIKEAILAGLGVAILARYAIGFDIDSQELAVLRVEGFPVESTWQVVYPASRHLSPIARAFVDMVKREAQTLLAETVSSVPAQRDVAGIGHALDERSPALGISTQ